MVSYLCLLKSNQLPNVPEKFRLTEKHFQLFVQCTDNIFTDKCAFWRLNTHIGKNKLYTVVSVNAQHQPLHRILYINYINPTLKPRMYLKHTCKNPMCLSLKHLEIKINIKKQKFKPQQQQITKNTSFNVSF